MSLSRKADHYPGERFNLPRSAFILSRQKELVLDLIAPQPGERILDIACGKGDNFDFFQGKWCSLTGIDSFPDKLNVARQRYGDRVELVLASPDDLPFPITNLMWSHSLRFWK